MTYTEGVSFFKLRYQRYLAGKDPLPKLEDMEILAELTVVQADLQNQYYLSVISSRDLTVPRLTLTPGQALYVSGTAAGNIPADIMHIKSVSTNDDLRTVLKPIDTGNFYNTTKTTSTPYHYSIYTAHDKMVMELDSYPSTALLMTIIYIPRYEPFYGTTDFTGSFKLPPQWNSVIVEGAVASVTGRRELMERYLMNVKQLIHARPSFDSGEIPARDATDERGRIIPPGYDLYY